MIQFCRALIIILGLTTGALAQSQSSTVQRATKGVSNQEIRIGVYVNVRPDCTSGPLPTIRLLTPPANGTVVVKKATVNATNYKQCLALQAPGYVAFYKSHAGYSGTDTARLEVTFPGGRIEIQEITITIIGGRSV